MKSAAQKHLHAIEAGTVEKTNVVGIRKALAHVARLLAGWSGNRCNATPYEARALEMALERVKPRVVGELFLSGLKLLQSKRYAKRWNDAEREVIVDIDVIRLVRFDRVNYGKGAVIVPVYCAKGCNGNSFVYRNIAWQSGGDGPEIEGRDF